MPELRIVCTTYDNNGNVVEEIKRLISDEELEKEALEHDINEAHITAKDAIRHWPQVTEAQKDQLLKTLLKFYIVSGEKLSLWPV